MSQVFSFQIQKLLPDSRQESNSNGNHDVDSRLIEEWTNQSVELDLDEDLKIDAPNEICLSSIAAYFFDEWTGETGWLFHAIEVKLPPDLRHILSDNFRNNQEEQSWFLPGMFCPRYQVVLFA